MKVVVLTGPESSGKTFLTERLQQRFGGLVVGSALALAVAAGLAAA